MALDAYFTYKYYWIITQENNWLCSNVLNSEVLKFCNHNCWQACPQDSPVTKNFSPAFTRVEKNSSVWIHHAEEFCWKLITCGQRGLVSAGFC